jgi:flavin reductase (DIM6/NTAB) family NADH-FMN oxidoreductase RutF
MHNEFNVREFRNALGSFVTGVTAVTTRLEDGRPVGFTANSFTSVSLDPPLILVCIGKSSSNFDTFAKTRHFCVNILAESQQHISQQFASKGVDRFAGLAWSAGALGSPVIDDSLAWFECALHESVDAGDHLILIGRVEEFGQTIGSPLAYCRGNYVLFELEQQVMSSRHHRARFGAILETPEGVLFVPGEKPGTLALPSASRLGTKDAKEGLFRALSQLVAEFEIEFLFSVWEADDADRLNVYYRGRAIGVPTAESVKICPVEAIPYDLLDFDDERLLKRYVEERSNFRFSVYSGTSSAGHWWEIPHRSAG